MVLGCQKRSAKRWGNALSRLFSVLFLATFALSASAHGQVGYPARPVTIVVPTGPGGVLDILARLLAKRLQERLGKPFITENMPGAGTNIGASSVARSVPDGHTLLVATSSTMAINASIYKSLPFDPEKDLIPVVLYARVPFVLVVNPAFPAQNVNDLISLAKSKPGDLNFGSSGTGTASHLFGEFFKAQAGINVAHVPYKSMAQPLSDLLGGHLSYMFSDLASALPLIREGKLRPLGVTSATRAPAASEIPTIAEVGLPRYEGVAWLMVVAPAQTPPAVLALLHEEMKAGLEQPEMREMIVRLGMIPEGDQSIPQLRSYVSSEILRWKEVVKGAGAEAVE